ncbi:MAG: MerR family transcriptional regulator [Erysipelotrichaceae bacterium]|nr:MerR family transcriptional regulator [Erysipelotrichaceae bacterium]MBQ6629682.1 MerR family transcriptional regulator [Methanobrevibacter sp.]
MEHFKTLKEVCNELKVSRRAIQGYESKQLIKPVAKNKYGHLLYNEEIIKRIAFIRFSQEIGFSINDISSLIDSPIEDIKNSISNQAEVLLREKETIERRLNQINRLNNLKSRDEYLDEVLTIIKGGSEG